MKSLRDLLQVDIMFMERKSPRNSPILQWPQLKLVVLHYPSRCKVVISGWKCDLVNIPHYGR